MTQGPELKWTSDLASAFRFIEKGVNEQPMVVIVYLVLSIVSGLFPPDFPLTRSIEFIGQIVLLQVACAVARHAWSEAVSEEERQKHTLARGGAPLISLVFLQVIYWLAMVALFFALILPSIWWAIKSSLALVFVCVDDLGAVAALKASHELLNDRFSVVWNYLLPIFLVVSIPMHLLWWLMRFGFDVLVEQTIIFPVIFGAQAISSLLRGVSYFVAQMLIVACLARLFAFLQAQQASQQ